MFNTVNKDCDNAFDTNDENENCGDEKEEDDTADDDDNDDYDVVVVDDNDDDDPHFHLFESM